MFSLLMVHLRQHRSCIFDGWLVHGEGGDTNRPPPPPPYKIDDIYNYKSDYPKTLYRFKISEFGNIKEGF